MTGDDIRDIRDNLGLTQQQLANRLARDIRTIQRWEAGEVAVPKSALRALEEISVTKRYEIESIVEPKPAYAYAPIDMAEIIVDQSEHIAGFYRVSGQCEYVYVLAMSNGRIGISWGGDSTWADWPSSDIEGAVNCYLNDYARWESLN